MELLVVIAIIAVLMGLVFPIASSTRERGNQTACFSNLQSIGQALKLYRLDEREYPPALYGWLENGAAEPTTFLYPQYCRSRREFKCPNNPNRSDETRLTEAFTGTTLPGGAVPMKKVAKSGGGYDVKPIWYPDASRSIQYYAFDSYDGGVLLPRAVRQVYPIFAGGVPPVTGAYEQHYRRDWASLYPSTPDQGDRELLNRNPEDSTYVTACTYHRNYRGTELAKGANSLDMVLFLDGHTEKRPSDEMIISSGQYDWTASPKYLIGQ
jgi:type II secretory pathway pseudopilin PulG